MNSFIKGMIAGGFTVSAALAGYAFGTADRQQSEDPWQDDQDITEARSCQVRVGYGRMTVGDECRFNQVMVGTRSNYLLCADLEVTCNP